MLIRQQLLVHSPHGEHSTLVGPHCDCTGWCSFDQAYCQASVETFHAFLLQDHLHGAKDATIIDRHPRGTDVLHPIRALNLQPLARCVEWKDCSLGQNTGSDTRDCISGAERKLDRRQRRLEAFVEGEEEAHVRHNLAYARSEPAEEASIALIAADLPDTGKQTSVHLLGPLRCKARPQQIQRVRDGSRRRARDSTGYEAFGSTRYLRMAVFRKPLKSYGCAPVSEELHSSVAQVQSFGGYVALPKPSNALMTKDVSRYRDDSSGISLYGS